MAGLGGSDGICHLAVLRVSATGNDLVIQAMIQKHILRRLLAGFYFLQFSVALLWLLHYSYRAKKLLVCWLFFCSLFAMLALAFLAIVLACYAGQYLAKWVSVARTVIPELAVCLVELPQEVGSGPHIIVAGPLKLTAGPCVVVNPLVPFMSINRSGTPVEEGVRK